MYTAENGKKTQDNYNHECKALFLQEQIMIRLFSTLKVKVNSILFL